MADDVVPEFSHCKFKMDQNEANFLALPPEIIRAVLILPSISLKDILSVAQSCQKMNVLVSDDCNDVWRAKHRQRWPDANKFILGTSVELDWQSECKRAFHLIDLTIKLMEQVWPKVYMESEVCYSHFAPLRQIMEEDQTAYFYIKDFLLKTERDGNMYSNLSRKYLAKRVLRFVRQEYLTKQWKIFKALPEDKQLLEVGASYVSQWCQPLIELPTNDLGMYLDSLSDCVLEELGQSVPDHPIFSVSLEERRKWGKENLASDLWNAKYCMAILRAMDYVLIDRLGFHGTKENYHHRENYLIDVVVSSHQGVPITLNIIVESVARRLGVRTEPWYRGHLVLMWQSDMNPELRHVYLDLFNGGRLIRPETYMGVEEGGGCPYRVPHCPKRPATVIEVIERLTAGVEVAGRMSMRSNGHSTYLRSALELMFVINPRNLTHILHLARLYMLFNISVSELIDSIMSTMDDLPSDVHNHAENILRMFKVYLPDPEGKPLPVPQTRVSTPSVKYAVGMSMFHKQYNYLCVITGWDPKCTATDTWKQEMGVQCLKHKDNQPFYNVLVPDGTTRYAAQENLEPLEGKDSLNTFNVHPDVGRYFDSYKNGYYIPNALKMAEYPNDVNICKKFYGKK